MIEINFLTSPDPEVIGKYKFFYDSINLGNSKKNDLIIDDPQVLDFHIKLSVSSEGIICEGIADTISFKGNDQYFKGKKTFGKKDKIKIGNTIFEILDFSPEPLPKTQLSLKESYEKIFQKFPEQERIIEEMENEISRLEGLGLNQPSSS